MIDKVPAKLVSRRALIGATVSAAPLGFLLGRFTKGPADETIQSARRGLPDDEFLHFFTLLNDLALIDGLTPLMSGRLIAYGSLAIDFVVLDDDSLVRTLNNAPLLPKRPSSQSIDTASTIATMLNILLPSVITIPTPATLATIRNEMALVISSRRQVASKSAIDASAAYGSAVALSLSEWAGTDGFAGTFTTPTLFTATPDRWRPTSSRPADRALDPLAAHLRPLALQTPDELVPVPQLQYSESRASLFLQQAEEVLSTSRKLTPEDKQIAQFWADGRYMSGTPAGHWLRIAAGLALGSLKPKPSRVVALTAVGLYDATLSCWTAKYRYLGVRPKPYINRVLSPNWSPFLATPSFPEYTSGHSTISSAAATVLEALGVDASFESSTRGNGMGEAVLRRSFESVWVAAEEASRSRLLAGIHFRHALDAGSAHGRRIGETVLKRTRLAHPA